MKDSQSRSVHTYVLYKRLQLCFGNDIQDRELERSTYSVSVQGLKLRRKAHPAY